MWIGTPQVRACCCFGVCVCVSVCLCVILGVSAWLGMAWASSLCDLTLQCAHELNEHTAIKLEADSLIYVQISNSIKCGPGYT